MTSISYRIFLFTLAFSPLAFGTVEQWSIITVEMLVVVALLLCLVALKVSRQPFLKVPGLLPLTLLLTFMLLQLIPLPPLLLKLFAPYNLAAYQPIVEKIPGNQWVPITLNQKASLLEFFKTGTYVLMYVLVIQLLRNKDLVRKTVIFLVAVGAVIAFFGILQQFSSDGKIFWFRSTPDGFPGGPWVYKNQYSSFLECLAPLALGLFIHFKPRVDEELSLRARFVSFFSSKRSSFYLFIGFAFVLLGTAIFVSLCRGGMVTFFISMLLMGVILKKKRKNGGKLAFWSVLGIVIMVITWYGWKPVVAEFDAGFSEAGEIQESRLDVWADSFGMIRDFPFTGSGFGTYKDTYPSYKTLQTDLIYDHAHNEYIELLTDGGIIGFGLAAWFVVVVLRQGWRMVLARKDNYAVTLGAGTFVGLCAVLIHCFFDFVLHNVAIGIYFFMLCGLMTAVLNTRYVHYEVDSLLPKASHHIYRLVLVMSSCFLVVLAGVHGGIIMARSSYLKVSSIYLSHLLDRSKMNIVKSGLEKAMMYDPLEGFYSYNRGEVAGYTEGREKAFEQYLNAARKQPMEGAYLQRVAVSMPPDQDEETRHLMQIGYKRALNKEKLVLGWVEWLLYKGERTEALKIIRERLETDRNFIIQANPILSHYKLSREELIAVLPENPGLWVKYGAFREKQGDLEDALFFRKGALAFSDNRELAGPWLYSQLMHFYFRQKEYDLAMGVLRKGVEAFPDHAPFHVRLGDYYKKEGIVYRAKEEYERAVMLEPGNEKIRNKLKQLEDKTL